MIKKDCYIYWKEIDGVKAVILLCAECSQKSDDKGVIWPSIWGYGDASIKCCDCGEVIYSGREKKKKQKR